MHNALLLEPTTNTTISCQPETAQLVEILPQIVFKRFFVRRFGGYDKEYSRWSNDIERVFYFGLVLKKIGVFLGVFLEFFKFLWKNRRNFEIFSLKNQFFCNFQAVFRRFFLIFPPSFFAKSFSACPVEAPVLWIRTPNQRVLDWASCQIRHEILLHAPGKKNQWFF